mmetsp:Transcript_13766/g.28997  ORF Transcript_13766/g.28997 Transcript_13766/m.28997 type:complete len:299 (-) Transcript_13766:7-903(-)
MIAEARASLEKSRAHDNFHPLCFTWKEAIHPNSNIQSPDVIAQPSDNATTVQHPLIQKLAHFLSTAQKHYATNLTVRTSLSNAVLALPDLLSIWSINETKRHFNYLTTDDTILMTFWLGLPSTVTYGQFKSTIMRQLQREKTWIKLHPMSMAHIKTALIGWFYKTSPLHTEYGKALFKQHQCTRDHLVERLSSLSRNNMTNFPLLKIPGVLSLHTTDRTVTSGSRPVVTTNDPLVATCIDAYIQKHYLTVLYDFPPNRSRKPSESATEAMKKAWISQTKDFTATAPPPRRMPGFKPRR